MLAFVVVVALTFDVCVFKRALATLDNFKMVLVVKPSPTRWLPQFRLLATNGQLIHPKICFIRWPEEEPRLALPRLTRGMCNQASSISSAV